MYDLQGSYHQHSLGPEASETGVLDARIHPHGLVALTGSLTFLDLKTFNGSKPDLDAEAIVNSFFFELRAKTRASSDWWCEGW